MKDKKKLGIKSTLRVEKTSVKGSRIGDPSRGVPSDLLNNAPEFDESLLEFEGIDLAGTMKELDKVDQAGKRMIEILTDCKRLAEEAAEEATTLDRRVVLQREADKLVDEYNLIATSADFSITRRLGNALNRNNN